MSSDDFPRRISSGRGLAAAAAAVVLAACGAADTPEVSFSADVQPIITKHCVACHTQGGLGYRKSGRRLDTYDEIMRGSGARGIVAPGSAASSKLVLYVHPSADPNMRMPFGGSTELTKSQVELISRWVDQGAKNN